MKKYYILVISFIFLLITCTEDAADPQSDVVPIDLPSYYGTYLYNDDDCSGSDIQYATLDENGITFFDFLGDNCDDTVKCYSKDIYEITEFKEFYVNGNLKKVIPYDANGIYEEYFEDGELKKKINFKMK